MVYFNILTIQHPTFVSLLAVPPQSPVIYTNDRMLAKNLQPLHEDSELMLMCEVTGGSPPPRVTWHWNGRLIDETFDRSYDVTVNTLDMNRVTRDLLSAQLICKASNTKLVQPTTAEIIVDVNCESLDFPLHLNQNK